MNLDHLQRFPDQNFEHRFNGCVGESIADVIGNLINLPCDPDFSEAAGYAAQAIAPSNGGEDLYAGMFGAVAFGVLPDIDDTSDPLQTSELIENNFANYTLLQKQTASIWAQNGIKQLNTYDDIAYWLRSKRSGVVMGMRWYASYNSPDPDGRLPIPQPGEPSTRHAVAVYEEPNQGLRIKPWEGPDFGDHGYVYMDRDRFARSYPWAYGFEPTAWRWMSLVQGAFANPHAIPILLPLIVAASGKMK